MNKNNEKLWIARFQFETGSEIKAYAICVEGKNIREALDIAENKAETFQFDVNGHIKGFRTVITDIGIADEDSRVLLYTAWPDPINDPDPELFN